MHPSISIIACIISIAFISQAGWLVLAQYALLLSALIFFVCKSAFVHAVKMTWRLKWLFLSIIVASSFFIPGEALIHAMGSWSPSYEGGVFGIQRAVILAEIIMLVIVLLETTSTEKLVQGLQWCLSPLGSLGVSVNKLSLRISLVLDEVRNPSVDLKKQLELNKHEKKIDRLVSTLTSVYSEITASVDAVENETMTVDALQRPSILQWALLLILVVVLYIPSRLF